jgi:hypothetical protein
MASHFLLVQSNPKEGRDAEYNDWYDQVHLHDVIKIPGFVAAQRFRVSGRMNGEQPPFEYLAIYEIEAEDVDHALARLSEASEKMVISDAIDLNDTNVFCVRALGPRISI